MTDRAELVDDFNRFAALVHASITSRNPVLEWLLLTPRARWKQRYRLERLQRRGAFASIGEVTSDYPFWPGPRVAKDNWLEL